MRRTKILHSIGEMMRDRFPEAKTYVYGSEARGDAQECSDIDLLVLLPNYSDISEYKNTRYAILDALFDLEIDNCSNFSPLVVMQNMWYSRKTPFTANVTREAILL